MAKIKIVEVQDDDTYYIDYCDTIKTLFPRTEWLEVQNDELEIYREYVDILNKKSKIHNSHYIVLIDHGHMPVDDFCFEEARKIVEEKREKDRLKAEKARERAKKAAETRKRNQAKNAKEKIIKGLIDMGMSEKEAQENYKKIQSKK